MNLQGFSNILTNCSNIELSKRISLNHSYLDMTLDTPLLAHEKTLYSQGKTGSCWLSSALFCISMFINNRDGIGMTGSSVFSKSYLMFYDKIERTKRFLSLIDSSIGDEQRMRYLLNHLVTDRGQWNMAKNLILRYGLIPYQAMSDPFHHVSSADLNAAINNLLKHYALRLMKGLTEFESNQIKQSIMKTVRTMLVQIFGEPPDEIDVPEVFQCSERLSPQHFFQKYIAFPFDDYLFICNFAEQINSYYEVMLDNNMEDGMPEVLLNLSDDDFRSAVCGQLEKEGFCWYTCDASKGFCQEKYAFDDPDYSGIFSGIQSYDMVRSRLSTPNHAMVLVGDTLRSENRWLLSHNSKGGLRYGNYIPVSKAWLNKYVFQAVVHKCSINLDYSERPYHHIMPFDLFYTT